MHKISNKGLTDQQNTSFIAAYSETEFIFTKPF